MQITGGWSSLGRIIVANTRLVKIETLSVKEMHLSLYYGSKFVEKARLTDCDKLSNKEILDTIEVFRVYGLGEE